MLGCSHSPSTSPSTPSHLTCLQSNLNVCFTASLSKNHKWCALKAVGRGRKTSVCVCGRRGGERRTWRKTGGQMGEMEREGETDLTGMDQAITD